MDGAVGITQCGISPGGTFTYRFDITEDETGTFWLVHMRSSEVISGKNLTLLQVSRTFPDPAR